MYETLLSPYNMPFTTALVVACSIGIIELLSLLLGGFTDLLDGFLPDKDISGGSFLDFLCIGRIPLLMWLVVYLFSYGIVGTIIQHFLHLNVILVGVVMVFLAVFPTRNISLFIEKIIPKDETTVVSEIDLVGYDVKIVVGKASVGKPAQGKLKDLHGQTHYIMVEPESSE